MKCEEVGTESVGEDVFISMMLESGYPQGLKRRVCIASETLYHHFFWGKKIKGKKQQSKRRTIDDLGGKFKPFAFSFL